MKILLAPVPHDEAAKFIAGKPAVGRAVFDRLLPELKARAFTISGIEAADTLQRARDLIAELPRGADWDTQKSRLIGEISPYLVDDQADEETRLKQVEAATRRAETLMRLHGFQAYAAAQHQVMERQRDAFPAWQYMTFGDGNVRPSHAALNGIVLPADHPLWKDHFPPWDWGCRCQAVPVTSEEADDASAAKAGAASGWAPGPEALKRMEQTGMLDLGDGHPVDIRSPRRRAEESGEDPAAKFGWNPGDLRVPMATILERYRDDPEVLQAFQSFARATMLPDGGKRSFSLLDWLLGKSAPAEPGTWKPVRSASEFQAATGYRTAVDAAATPRQAVEVLNAVGRERTRLWAQYPALAKLDSAGLLEAFEINVRDLAAAKARGEYSIVHGRIRLHPKVSSRKAAREQDKADASIAGRAYTAYDVPNAFRHEVGHAVERLLTFDEKTALLQEHAKRNVATTYREISGYANQDASEAFAELFNLIASGRGPTLTSFPSTQRAIRRVLGL